MNQTENYFLSYLENHVPSIAQCAKKMEDLIFEDPSSAMGKARLFLEGIIKYIWEQEKIEEYNYSSLSDRITYLVREGYINGEIRKAFDTIRRSGNKAVHDAEYEDVVQALVLHKEMYKIAVWIYEVYINEQFYIPPYVFPKQKPTSLEVGDMMEQIGKQLTSKIGKDLQLMVENLTSKIAATVQDEPIRVELPMKSIEVNSVPVKEVETELMDYPFEKVSGSYLIGELSRLRISSSEAVENAQSFSQFKKYLHVERPIQKQLEEILSEQVTQSKGNLILLCGSVGDGKSHLLAYLNEERKELMHRYTIFNDATESFSPSKTAMETLEDILKSFSDQNIESQDDHVMIAINLGVLHNFIYRKHENYTYEKLKQFVEKSELFTPSVTTHFTEGTFDLLSFADYQPFELTPNGPQSSFFKSLLQKITQESNDNPFYIAMQKDAETYNPKSIIHENFEMLCNPYVQEQIIQLVIQVILQYKVNISSRHFLNFIADILIPINDENIWIMSDVEKIEHSLPSLLFNRPERSDILQVMSKLNPIHKRSNVTDQIMVELNTLNEWSNLIQKMIPCEIARKWYWSFENKLEFTDTSLNTLSEVLLCTAYLTNETFAQSIQNEIYNDYVKNLHAFNVFDRQGVPKFYDEIKNAIFNWKGSPKKKYIYMNKALNDFILAQELPIHPSISHLQSKNSSILDSFKSVITVQFLNQKKDESIFLEIDYKLYALLRKVNSGYRPNLKDEEDALTFIEFLEKIMSFGLKKKEILIHFVDEKRQYSLQLDDFGRYVFERVTKND